MKFYVYVECFYDDELINEKHKHVKMCEKKVRKLVELMLSLGYRFYDYGYDNIY